MYADSIAIPVGELRSILMDTMPGDPLLPELDRARENIAAFRQSPPARLFRQAGETFLADTDVAAMPQLTYSLYRTYRRTGLPQAYGRAYEAKRTRFTVAALCLLLGDDDWLDPVQDHVWSICEETTWVSPYHEPLEVDLPATGTGAMLANLVVALEDKLVDEVCHRVRVEIDRRILVPYLDRHDTYWWYRGRNNWNGVCNGSIGSMFLLLEADCARLSRALALVLAGLDVYVHTAFEEDGASTEGVGYWQYGLSHLVEFSELLRQRTRGRIDLLSTARMKAIAGYPLRVMLSPGRYASFADSVEGHWLWPGFINRLAERTGVPELVGVLAEAREPVRILSSGDFPASLRQLRMNTLDIAMRVLLWWDGRRPATAPALADSYLPIVGLARLVSQAATGIPVVVALKAGHNDENHNHNDVGSLIFHVDGETFLCDPGPGLYARGYFTPARYENVLASSYGHSVPRISGHTQSPGREFRGQVTAFESHTSPKRVTAEIGTAYSVPDLAGIRRTVALASPGDGSGTAWITDSFTFNGKGQEIEEAFVTWLDAEISGPIATLHGSRHDVRLVIEEPAGATFALATLEEECRANKKEGVLKRLMFALPPEGESQARVRIEVVPSFEIRTSCGTLG